MGKVNGKAEKLLDSIVMLENKINSLIRRVEENDLLNSESKANLIMVISDIFDITNKNKQDTEEIIGGLNTINESINESTNIVKQIERYLIEEAVS